MEEEDIKKIARKVLQLSREEIFEQSPSKAEMSNEDLLKKLTASLIEHRSPCHDLSEDDMHTLKSIIKGKLRLAKTKGAVKLTVIGLVLREIWLILKENLHWGP